VAQRFSAALWRLSSSVTGRATIGLGQLIWQSVAGQPSRANVEIQDGTVGRPSGAASDRRAVGGAAE